MWKWTPKHEKNPDVPTAAPPVQRVSSQEPVETLPTAQSVESFNPEVTRIGKSIVIKGEVSGSEDTYLDGELEGSVGLVEGSLTVGPDGRIRADLQARNIVIQGRVIGNLYGLERVELKKSAVFVTPHCHRRWRILGRKRANREGDSQSPKERGRHGRREIACCQSGKSHFAVQLRDSLKCFQSPPTGGSR